MLLLKELPNSKSLAKLLERYPEADVNAISDFVYLLRASSDLSAALDNLLAQHNLLQGRWWVLVLLMRQDDLTSTPTDLAEKAGVTKASMTGFIDGLEREGLVVRLQDTQDRRKLLVRLTRAGQRKMDAITPDYCKKIEALMSCLTLGRRKAMLDAIGDLSANISAMS